MDTPITRAEHEEFRKRLEADNKRQDRRIEILEENTKRLETLNTSIEKLAVNMENMLREQMKQGERLEQLESRNEATELNLTVERINTAMENVAVTQEQQGRRLETLEARDGKMWRKVVGYALTAAIGIILGFIFKQIGL